MWYWLPPLALLLCFRLTPDALRFLPLVAGHGASAWCPQVDVAAQVKGWSLAIGTGWGFVSIVFLVGDMISRYPHGTDAPSGVCVKCGYDLRATPERCPECGTLVAALRGRRDHGGGGADTRG